METLTPIEALNFLYELKKTLKGQHERLMLSASLTQMQRREPLWQRSMCWINTRQS